MKKKLVGLVLGILAFASMISLAQAGTTGDGPTFINGNAIATTTGVQVIDAVSINDSRNVEFAMKSGMDEGGGLGVMTKSEGGNWWKLTSDSGTLKQATSILTSADHTITVRPLLSPSFATATSLSSLPARDLMATTSFPFGFQGEKTRSSHVPSAGIGLALEPNDHGWREGKSTS